MHRLFISELCKIQLAYYIGKCQHLKLQQKQNAGSNMFLEKGYPLEANNSPRNY